MSDAQAFFDTAAYLRHNTSLLTLMHTYMHTYIPAHHLSVTMPYTVAEFSQARQDDYKAAMAETAGTHSQKSSLFWASYTKRARALTFENAGAQAGTHSLYLGFL